MKSDFKLTAQMYVKDKMDLQKNKEIAMCRKCKTRYYGFPEQCKRCGNTKFRRCKIRKKEENIIHAMKKNIDVVVPTIRAKTEICAVSKESQKGVAFELISPSESGANESMNAFLQSHDSTCQWLPKEYYKSENKGYSFFERHSVTGEEHFIHGEVGIMNYREKYIVLSCPFCLSRKLVKRGFRYNKNGRVQRYKCIKCNKRFSNKNYFAMKTPDYIIEYFLHIFASKKFKSTREIAKIIFTKFNYKVSFQTISLWERKYRKQRLWKKRIPNSKINHLIKPKDLEYIPKIVIFKQTNQYKKTYERRLEFANIKPSQ